MTPSLFLGFVLGLLGLASNADSGAASPRIQFLGRSDFPREAGCVGWPAGSLERNNEVLAWAPSSLAVVKIDGSALRLAPGAITEYQTEKGQRRRGDRLRQEWSSGRITLILDLVVTSDCRSGQECEGTSYDGDFTVQVNQRGQASAQKSIRIHVECGC
jgi:hypothetical protein